MKKILAIALLLAVMGGAMAQNEGTREYVSALITFNDTTMLPQDSLNKYGVVLQTRSGRMATALIDANKYQSFLNANLVERVQPSTRVFLRDEQINATEEKHECCKHGNKNVRQNLIPQQEILNADAEGWYVGMLLGGSSNRINVESARWGGTWYMGRGINLEARVGYQSDRQEYAYPERHMNSAHAFAELTGMTFHKPANQHRYCKRCEYTYKNISCFKRGTSFSFHKNLPLLSMSSQQLFISR